MAKKRPGRKAKDAVLSEGFNSEKKLTLMEKRQIAQQKKLLADAKKKKREKELLEKLAKKQAAEKEKQLDDADGEGPDGLSYQMLQDMRWVYQRMGGRKALKDFVKKNDKAYELMVKELMKIESAMKQAEIRKTDPGTSSNQNVFVVLKGLEDENRTMGVVTATDGQRQIDLKSLGPVLRPSENVDTTEIPLDEEDIIRPEKG